MHQFIAESEWSDETILERVRDYVLPKMDGDKGYCWIIDDTSFPKQGKHSVGVARQYCGALGKLANCQVAVSLSVATQDASLPVAYRLYLPQAWAEDKARRDEEPWTKDCPRASSSPMPATVPTPPFERR